MTIAQVQVNLFCRDVESCLAFYTGLGLSEAFRAPATGPVEHAEVEVAGMRLGLTSGDVANRLVDLGVAPGSTPAAELVLWCDDVDAWYERALTAGATGAVATGAVAPTDSADGRLRFAWVRDPDEHQVKLVRPHG